MSDALDIVLIDLSSIAHPLFHLSASDPNPDATSQKTVERVRALAAAHKHVAICCDAGKSFRHDVSATYKANRLGVDRAAVHHQIDLAIEILRTDGFPIWRVPGFEADDVIATAAMKADTAGHRSVVVSSDKDLLALVSANCVAKSAKDGALFDAEAVEKKFGVKPHQMWDFLTLVGDASDNIRGVTGVGEKTAAALLKEWGSIDAIYAAIDAGATPTLTPVRRTALQNFRPELPTTRTLVMLRFDVPISFDDVFRERVPTVVEPFDEEPVMETVDTTTGEVIESPAAPAPAQASAATTAAKPAGGSTAMVPMVVDVPSTAEYERQLEPRSLGEATKLATYMHQARMFSAYGSAPAVLSTIMVGRELGLPATASLRQIHNVEGKHALSADLLVALVLRSGFAEYFRPVEISATKVTFTTRRKGDEPFTLTYTIEQATTAKLVKPGSGWEKNPDDMLAARCKAKLARLIYPDVVSGLYTPDELSEGRLSGDVVAA